MQQPAVQRHQPGPLGDDLTRQVAQPRLKLRPALLVHGRVAEGFDGLRCQVVIAGLYGVRNRLVRESMTGEPAAGAGMKLRDLLRAVLPVELLAQKLLKEVVIAKPVRIGIQRLGEEVGCCQPLERFSGVRRRGAISDHCGAQPSSKPVEDRSSHQKFHCGGWNVVEYLVHEEVNGKLVGQGQL